MTRPAPLPDPGNPRPSLLRSFLFPTPTRRLGLRLVVVACVTVLVCKYLAIPARTNGSSMEPTYRDRQWLICWRPAYWFSAPRRGDVVCVELDATRIMYLKRVVALAGEQVEFRGGVLYVDDKPVDEPYVRNPCSWHTEPTLIRAGHVFVVGDNRATSPRRHTFGQVHRRRIVGRAVP